VCAKRRTSSLALTRRRLNLVNDTRPREMPFLRNEPQSEVPLGSSYSVLDCGKKLVEERRNRGPTVDIVTIVSESRPRISPQKRRKRCVPLSTYETSRVEIEIVHIRSDNCPEPSVNGCFIRWRRSRCHAFGLPRFLIVHRPRLRSDTAIHEGSFLEVVRVYMYKCIPRRLEK
jgi:hypothetical protein